MNVLAAVTEKETSLYFECLAETIIGRVDTKKIIINQLFRYDEELDYYIALLLEAIQRGYEYCSLELKDNGLKRIYLNNVPH